MNEKCSKCKPSAQFERNIGTFELKTPLHALGEHAVGKPSFIKPTSKFKGLSMNTATLYTKNEKHLKNVQRSRDAAAKKRANASGVGKINNFGEDIYIYLPTTSNTHLLLTMPTSNTHRFHPLSKIVIHTSAHPYCTEVWMTIWRVGGIYGCG